MTLEARPALVPRALAGRRSAAPRLLVLASLLAWAAPPLLLSAGADPGTPRAADVTDADAVTWLDRDGRPLPFRTYEEVETFLKTAAVVSRETAPVGITRPEILVLEKDGVQARAILRLVEEEKQRIRIGGRYCQRFRDSQAHECAAYALARALGLDSVPPVVPRRLGPRPGSVQIWVEGTRDETAADFRPPSSAQWVRQIWDRILFDNLILNVDRNAGNLLVGPDYRIWLIDHTRAFQPQSELLDPDELEKVNREAWARLGAMSDDDLKDAVRDHLDVQQLEALVARRGLLVERVRRLVAERGEAAVFY